MTRLADECGLNLAPAQRRYATCSLDSGGPDALSSGRNYSSPVPASSAASVQLLPACQSRETQPETRLD